MIAHAGVRAENAWGCARERPNEAMHPTALRAAAEPGVGPPQRRARVSQPYGRPVA